MGTQGEERSSLQAFLFLFHLAWSLSSSFPRNVVIQVYIPIKLDFEFKSPIGVWREVTQGKVWAATPCSLFWEPRALQGSARWGWSRIQGKDPGEGSRGRIQGQDPGAESRSIPGTDQGGEGGEAAAG